MLLLPWLPKAEYNRVLVAKTSRSELYVSISHDSIEMATHEATHEATPTGQPTRRLDVYAGIDLGTT
jgi:hypothetical protein